MLLANAILILFLFSIQSYSISDFKNNDIKMINSSLGCKSPYPSVRFNIVNNPPSECKLKQIQMVSRHGARYPAAASFPSFHQLAHHLTRYHDTLKETNPYLSNWSMPFEIPDELADSGRAELEVIATRLRSRHGAWLSSLFDRHNQTSSKRIIVRASNKSRVIESAKVFMKALLPPESQVPLEILDRVQDADLVPHESCKAFKSSYSNNSSSIMKNMSSRLFSQHVPSHESANLLRPKHGKSIEAQKFISENFPLMVDRLSQRLQIPLTINLFIFMLEMCGHEVAIFHFYHGFCNLFLATNCKKDDDECGDLDKSEIVDDLMSYYDYGYGSQINKDMMCSLITDILESAILKADENPLLLRFTHAETILPLASALGLFHDNEPLTAKHHPASRAWKASFVAPYSSNLQIEVYDCEGSHGQLVDGRFHQDGKNYQQYVKRREVLYNTRKVRILWNEQTRHSQKLIRLPGCQDEFCSLTSLVAQYKDAIHCNFDERCGNEEGSTIGGWTRFSRQHGL